MIAKNSQINTVENLAVICLASIMAFPRSFVFLKLSLILVYLGFRLIRTRRWHKIGVSGNLLAFYTVTASIGLIWSLIGLLRGNPEQAIVDSLRLYVAWSFAFSLIFTLLQGARGRLSIHYALVSSGYIIFIVNLIGIIDSAFGLDLVPYSLKKELDMFIGFHDGYIQITSHNIGSLFFLIPYFYVILSNKRETKFAGMKEKIVFLLLIFLAIVSGRRALWICLMIIPLLDYSINKFIKSSRETYSGNILSLYVPVGLIIALILSFTQEQIQGNSTISRLADAFSDEDERTIQMGYLIDGFFEYPLLGSGFGGYAGYTRNIESPWLYELTYFQIAFNLGVVGMVIFYVLFFIYFNKVIRKIRIDNHLSLIDTGLFIGAISLLIGSYSNPYLGSFDFLLYLGMIPYIAQSVKKLNT